MPRPWIRLYTDLPHSAKIQRLPDHLFRFLINCWCFTGSSKDDSLPSTEDIAFQLHIDPKICQAYIDHLLEQNILIRRQGSGKIAPKNFDDRQFLSDSSRDRVRKYREKIKKPTVKRSGNVTVTVQDSDSDTDTDSDTEPPNPQEAIQMTPMLDEQFQEYRRLFEAVGNPIEEDFANGSFCWRAWCLLSFEQRTKAIDGLAARKLAGVDVLHTAESYLSKLEYKRPLRKASTNGSLSRHDQIRKAMEEA